MFDLANGCNSCEPIGSNLNNTSLNNTMNNQNMMDMNNQNMMNMNNQQQPQQQQPQQQQQQQQQQQPKLINNMNNNQLSEDIRNAVTKGVMNRVQKNLNNNSKIAKKVEAQAIDLNSPDVNDKKEETKKLVMFGLVVLAALSWNEASRFMLEQNLKFNEGNNTSYYIAYAVVVTLVVVFVKKMLD